MIRWSLVYPGRMLPEQSWRKAAPIPPSWWDFDRKVWERWTPEAGRRQIVLTNLQRKAPFKSATYRVEWTRDGRLLGTIEGHDWQAMVRAAKAVDEACFEPRA